MPFTGEQARRITLELLPDQAMFIEGSEFREQEDDPFWIISTGIHGTDHETSEDYSGLVVTVVSKSPDTIR